MSLRLREDDVPGLADHATPVAEDRHLFLEGADLHGRNEGTLSSSVGMPAHHNVGQQLDRIEIRVVVKTTRIFGVGFEVLHQWHLLCGKGELTVWANLVRAFAHDGQDGFAVLVASRELDRRGVGLGDRNHEAGLSL
jgi:hypothetical protein